MDCTYVPCAKGLDCMHTTVNPRIVPGGRQSIDRMYDYIVCTKHGQPSLRHAEKGYHFYMQAFATEY